MTAANTRITDRMGPLRWLRAGPSGSMGKPQCSCEAYRVILRRCQLCWSIVVRRFLICGTHALDQAVTPTQLIPLLHILVRH